MGLRTDLQSKLEALLGSRNVYFQPPATVKIQYPCIIYTRHQDRTNHADNVKYQTRKSYQVTVVDKDPDSLIPDKVFHLPLCRFDRHYTADNLNHDVFILYY